MSEIETGGLGLPANWVNISGVVVPDEDGMTLRDYFAAKALPAVFAEAMAEAREGSGLFQCPEWRVGLALDAYKMADAMMKARGS